MPIYVYRCPDCGKVAERQRPMANRNDEVACRSCWPKTDPPHGIMKRVFTAPSFIIRPSGWNLRPGDPGYGDFSREFELGEVRGPSAEGRVYTVDEDEMPASPIIAPSYDAMRELHQMGEVLDRAIQERTDLPEVYGEGS